jgi:hypothetical protein
MAGKVQVGEENSKFQITNYKQCSGAGRKRRSEEARKRGNGETEKRRREEGKKDSWQSAVGSWQIRSEEEMQIKQGFASNIVAFIINLWY